MFCVDCVLVDAGEVFLRPVADEVEHSALVMRFLGCGLLSRCAGLLHGIENVREVLFGACVPRGPLVVLVLVLHCNPVDPQGGSRFKHGRYLIAGWTQFHCVPTRVHHDARDAHE